MIRRGASISLLVTAGLVVSGVLVAGALQLAPAAGSAAAGGGKSTTAPGQVKKTATPTPSPTAPAEPPPKKLAITPSPLTVTGLAPGVSFDRTILVTNPNNQDVVLQSVTVAMGLASPAPAPGTSCTSPADVEVLLSPGTPVDIAKNGSRAVPVVVRMNNTATNQDGCKDKTFHFTLTATATSK